MQARIVAKGLFACFDSGLTDADGAPVNVEISAVAWNGERLVFGSDKNIPGAHRSPVFSLAIEDGRPVEDSLSYYSADLIKSAEKYEDFALTEDGAHMVATTGFDRVAEDGAHQDVYNRLLVWPCGSPDAPQLVAERDDTAGVRSSVALRADLAAVLGAPYSKIEGLASVPGEQGGDPLLLFGIREIGSDHENFDYVAKVVGVPYRMSGDALTLTGDFELAYEFDPSSREGVRFEVGLSSLEYDPARRRLYFLTSFEVDDGAGGDHVGAYLWSAPLADFRAGVEPALVSDENGEVLEFRNKAEGVAVLPDGRLFVVYDPDRALELEDDHPQAVRGAHEAPYTLLELVTD
ncbi:hypothetical protein [Salinisphaera sp.]|uniref:hypothetical protein n=1 Tax=Salinisphaera sp. TaxID=1914330 RepID=UPI002D779390|nr:hypothetical protein [Salinisphaera sp.]HET7314368.1 hypothetical protein [Salinisphaera sp.]